MRTILVYLTAVLPLAACDGRPNIVTVPSPRQHLHKVWHQPGLTCSPAQ